MRFLLSRCRHRYKVAGIQVSGEYGFEIAVHALEEGVQRSRTSFHDAAILAARIAGYGLNMAPERGQDLHVYDEFMEGVQV